MGRLRLKSHEGGSVSHLSARRRQVERLLRTEGLSGVSGRLRRRLANRLSPPGSEPLPVGDDEFSAEVRLSANGWKLPKPAPWWPGEPLRVSWVCDPPAPGSGGHTTMFRLIRALENKGHSSTLYLVDRHGWDLEEHKARIREGWPDVTAEVRTFDSGVRDCHALFATGWASAWTCLRTEALGLRCYLVQDFEPLFHAAGSHSLLAEATYSFGYQGVTAGKWLPTLLASKYGMHAEGFEFGCDRRKYFLINESQPRREICYYCRPSSPRRAHELAIAALRQFSKRNPGVQINFYGERVANVDFPVLQHGVLTPQGLNELYNSCAAGLALSATNVSLVPHEMLASGCIPVVNDAEHNRLVLNNDQVRYAAATPNHLASALEDIVKKAAAGAPAHVDAAKSVDGQDWESVGLDFVDIVEKLVRAASAQ